MHICLLLFAGHREITGQSRLNVTIPSGASVQDVYDLLQQRYPRLVELRTSTSFAVNREMVEPDTLLQPGDEVAFLLPVSGGYG